MIGGGFIGERAKQINKSIGDKMDDKELSSSKYHQREIKNDVSMSLIKSGLQLIRFSKNRLVDQATLFQSC